MGPYQAMGTVLQICTRSLWDLVFSWIKNIVGYFGCLYFLPVYTVFLGLVHTNYFSVGVDQKQKSVDFVTIMDAV